MKKLLLLFHTVRYLKPAQIYLRILRKAKKLKYFPIQSHFKPPKGEWSTCPLYSKKFLNENTAVFLNETGKVHHSSDWNNPDRSHLWLFNLHYFDHLCSKEGLEDTQLSRFWIDKWLRNNRKPHGNGWEPYPLSLRIVNWLKFHLSTNILNTDDLESLALQAHALWRTLEVDLMANHLFVNAKALLYASVCLDTPYATKWKTQSLNVLVHELNEQILPDGGNFELSPMYHDIMIVDLLDILNLYNAYPYEFDQSFKSLLEFKIQQMLVWRQKMLHPDGGVAFFNDTTFGIAPETEVLETYSQHLGFNHQLEILTELSEFLEHSGYYVFKSSHYSFIIDLAEIGASYQPSHAHADTLSFEFCAQGQRIFVNRGISLYGGSPERVRQRSTLSHNTVVIDGENSSEVWGGFRVARRAYPQINHIEINDGFLEIDSSHNGYQRLKGRPIHRRIFRSNSNDFIIRDEVKGEFQTAEAYFYLHPEIRFDVINENNIKIFINQDEYVFHTDQPMYLNKDTYCEGYSKEVQCPVIRVKFNTKGLISTFKKIDQ